MTDAAKKVAAAALLGHERLALDTAEAVAIARELDLADHPHGAQVKAAIEAIDAIDWRAPNASGDVLAAYGQMYAQAAASFWDGFVQTNVNGVEIVRKHAVPAAKQPEVHAEEQA